MSLKKACVLFVAGADSALASDPPPSPRSTRTRFPIVLAGGLFGFDFFAIPEDLRSGGAKVFTTQVNPFSTNRARAAELLKQVEEIRARTGAEKVNLIGHSQGGLDARSSSCRHLEWQRSIGSSPQVCRPPSAVTVQPAPTVCSSSPSVESAPAQSRRHQRHRVQRPSVRWLRPGLSPRHTKRRTGGPLLGPLRNGHPG